jgi:hypothetical protein
MRVANVLSFETLRCLALIAASAAAARNAGIGEANHKESVLTTELDWAAIDRAPLDWPPGSAPAVRSGYEDG